MVTVTEYKYRVSKEELKNPVPVKNYKGKRKEMEERMTYLNGLEVRFAVEGEEIFVEGCA